MTHRRPSRLAAPVSLALYCIMLCSLAAAQTSATADLQREYHNRARALPREDVTGRLELAQWCIDNNLDQNAARLYRAILDIRPENTAAYDQLIRLSIKLGLSDYTGPEQALLRQLGDDFHAYPCEHFLVFYDHSLPWAENRGRMLELAYKRFYATFSLADFRPLPLQHRLQALAFSDYADFSSYARKYDARDNDWSMGYYSSRTNRIAFFDAATGPQVHQTTEDITALQSSITSLETQLQQAIRLNNSAQTTQLQLRLRPLRSQLTNKQQQFQLITSLTNIVQSIHEAIHQLAFNSGLQKSNIVYPFWFSEGLATSFETLTPAAPFGPTHDNPFRRRRFVQAYRRHALLTIDQLIDLKSAPDDPAQREAAYAQSWALFAYLFTHRTQALRSYVMAKRAQSPADLSPEQLHAEFIQYFGSPNEIQTETIRYVLSLDR